MTQSEVIEHIVKRETDKAYWFGVAMGLVGGFIAGALFWP